MIKHIVFFRLKACEEKAARLEEIKTELEKLPAAIPALRELHVGINANPAETWDFCLEAVVEDMEQLAVYANHPAHQAVVKNLIAPLKEDRACVDYRI